MAFNSLPVPHDDSHNPREDLWVYGFIDHSTHTPFDSVVPRQFPDT